MRKVLDKLAKRAQTIYASGVTSDQPSKRSISALSICSAALAQLVSQNKTGEDAVLTDAARGCTVQLLEQMTNIPNTEVLETKTTFRIFKIMKDGPLFLAEQESLLLLEQLDRLTNAVAIGAWSPAHLLACLHAIAKGCPNARPPSFTTDILLCLEHSFQRLGPREVASFMWSMAVLHLHETNGALWHKVCHRVCTLFGNMNEISKATVAHCAFIVPEAITPELSQMLYSTFTGKHGNSGWDSSNVFKDALPPREREIQRNLKLRMLTNTGAYSAELLLTTVENALNASHVVDIDDDVRLAAHHLSKRKLAPNEYFRILLLNDRNMIPSYQLDSHNTFALLYHHALKALLTSSSPPPPPLMTLLSLSTLLASSMRQAFLPFAVELDTDTMRKVWGALLLAMTEGVQTIESDFDCPSGELTAALLAANAVATNGLLSAQLPPSLMAEVETVTAKASALLKSIPTRWFRSSRQGLDKCANFLIKVCEYKEDVLLITVECTRSMEILHTISSDMPSHLEPLPFIRLLDLVFITETAPRALQPLLAPLTTSLLGQVELQRMTRRKILHDVASVIRLHTVASTSIPPTRAVIPDSLFSLYIEALLNETGTAECPQNWIDLVVACLAQRTESIGSLETGFTKLMTRQLGQENSFFHAVSLNPATIVRFIDLASVLLTKKMSVGVSILTTLFQLLSESVELQCHNLQALNEVASVFSSDVCVKLHMKEKLVEAVEKRAITLLTQPNNFSARDKAFFIAHFVNSKVPIKDPLDQALHLVYDDTYIV